jgi:hypothetical protein
MKLLCGDIETSVGSTVEGSVDAVFVDAQLRPYGAVLMDLRLSRNIAQPEAVVVLQGCDASVRGLFSSSSETYFAASQAWLHAQAFGLVSSSSGACWSRGACKAPPL